MPGCRWALTRGWSPWAQGILRALFWISVRRKSTAGPQRRIFIPWIFLARSPQPYDDENSNRKVQNVVTDTGIVDWKYTMFGEISPRHLEAKRGSHDREGSFLHRGIDLSHPLEPRWSKPRLMTKAAEVHV